MPSRGEFPSLALRQLLLVDLRIVNGFSGCALTGEVCNTVNSTYLFLFSDSSMLSQHVQVDRSGALVCNKIGN